MDNKIYQHIDQLIDSINDRDVLIAVEDYLSTKIIGKIYPNGVPPIENSITSHLVKAIQRIEDMRNSTKAITGITTGFPKLNNVTNGWQKGDLIVLASRPSVGKSALGLNLACNAALDPHQQTTVAFFSLELTAEKVVHRILSAESEIWLEKISRGKMEDHEMGQLYKRGIQRLADAKLFIDDTPALNIFELRDKCRQLKQAHDIGFIIVDYLQLLKGIKYDSNREQDLSLITRELKALAKELNLPIVLLSQLSREVEKRKDGNKMPQLSDLRDSGSIEENADMVCFIYRPEYHDLNQNEMGESVKGETYLRIAKHRNGSLENLKFRARLEIQKFFEDDGGDFNNGFTMLPNWKPVSNPYDHGSGARFFVQTGTQVNDLGDDDEPF